MRLIFLRNCIKERNYLPCGEVLLEICIIYTNHSSPPWGVINLQEKNTGRPDWRIGSWCFTSVWIRVVKVDFERVTSDCGLDGHIWTYQGLQGQWWDALKMTHFMTRMYPAYMTTRIKLSHLRGKQEKKLSPHSKGISWFYKLLLLDIPTHQTIFSS